MFSNVAEAPSRYRASGEIASSSPQQEIVRFDRVLTRLGDQVIYDHISFSIKAGEFICILGPSGCGKSTALRLIGGLLQPDSGDVVIAGGTPANNWKRIAYVFQSPRLAPWRTALANVEMGMELRGGWTRNERRERALNALQLVGLHKEAARLPAQLSGGERQRIAIARALAVDPEIILMDEPFSALDPNTRALMRNELLELWNKTGKTVIFVTHDIDEALVLADRVLAFSRKPTRLERSLSIDQPRPRDLRCPTLHTIRDELLSWFSAMDIADGKIDCTEENLNA